MTPVPAIEQMASSNSLTASPLSGDRRCDTDLHLPFAVSPGTDTEIVLSTSTAGLSGTEAATALCRWLAHIFVLAMAISVSMAASAADRSLSAVSVTSAAVVWPTIGSARSCGGMPLTL